MPEDNVRATAKKIQLFYADKTVQEICDLLKDSESRAYAQFDNLNKRNMGLLLSLSDEAATYKESRDQALIDMISNIKNFYDVVDALMKASVLQLSSAQKNLIDAMPRLEKSITTWLTEQENHPTVNTEQMHKSLLTFAKTMNITLDRFFTAGTWESWGMKKLFNASAPMSFSANDYKFVRQKHTFIQTIIDQCTNALMKIEDDKNNPSVVTDSRAESDSAAEMVEYHTLPLDEQLKLLNELKDYFSGEHDFAGKDSEPFFKKLMHYFDYETLSRIDEQKSLVSFLTEKIADRIKEEMEALQENLKGMKKVVALFLATVNSKRSRLELFLSYLGFVWEKTKLINQLKEIDKNIEGTQPALRGTYELPESARDVLEKLTGRVKKMKEELCVLSENEDTDPTTQSKTICEQVCEVITSTFRPRC